jgi:hypothetical protein
MPAASSAAVPPRWSPVAQPLVRPRWQLGLHVGASRSATCGARPASAPRGGSVRASSPARDQLAAQAGVPRRRGERHGVLRQQVVLAAQRLQQRGGARSVGRPSTSASATSRVQGARAQPRAARQAARGGGDASWRRTW